MRKSLYATDLTEATQSQVEKQMVRAFLQTETDEQFHHAMNQWLAIENMYCHSDVYYAALCATNETFKL